MEIFRQVQGIDKSKEKQEETEKTKEREQEGQDHYEACGGRG